MSLLAAAMGGTLALSSWPATAPAEAGGALQEPPSATYYLYVGAESADLLHRVRFGPGGAAIDKTTPVGEMAVETEGPHGLNISADGQFLYMTTGHGVPDGKLWKFHAGPDTLVADPVLLGYFPATLDVTPGGLYAFVANFNLHGEMAPSTVSVVYTPAMVEVEQIETCVMPHGARLDAAGDFLYSACMMDDQVVEIDTRTFEVARRFSVALGAEGPIGEGAGYEGHGAYAGHGNHADHGVHADHGAHGAHAGHGAHADHVAQGAHGGHGAGAGRASERAAGARSGVAGAAPTCSPTWVTPRPGAGTVVVACNAGDRILEIDRETWTLRQTIASGRGPYNLALAPDGRLLAATLKQGAGVQFFDLEEGRALATTPSSTTVTHGVVVSPDGRYAFVSVEGVGAEPGKVDVYDLATFARVADVEVGQQAGGIAFWKMTAGEPQESRR